MKKATTETAAKNDSLLKDQYKTPIKAPIAKRKLKNLVEFSELPNNKIQPFNNNIYKGG